MRYPGGADGLVQAHSQDASGSCLERDLLVWLALPFSAPLPLVLQRGRLQRDSSLDSEMLEFRRGREGDERSPGFVGRLCLGTAL